LKIRAYRADGLMLLAALIWGGAFVAQRVGIEHVGPLTFNGVRFALGALTLLPLLWVAKSSGLRSDGRPGWTARLNLLGGGFAGVVLFGAASLQQVGLVYTTAGKAGFITGLYVILVPVARFLSGRPVGAGAWIGALLATAGLYLLSVTEDWKLAPGDLWVLASAFLWAAHVMVLGWVSPRADAVPLACTQYLVCSFLSMVVAVSTETVALGAVGHAALPILYGGVLSVGVAYTLQVLGQRDAPPVHAAILLSMEAVFAALAGWAMLGESLNTRGLRGCALMFAGMLVAQLWQPPSLGRQDNRRLDSEGKHPKRV
jgi:drug/metabolite transporter (DMT)-like permease